MFATRFVLALFLMVFGSASALEAQGTVGDWEITQPDGSAIVEGSRFGIDITEEDGQVVGKVWVDSGEGRVEIPGETATFTQLGLSGIWEWTNARGNTGIVFFNEESRQWESIVLTGPNSGTTRAWTPRTDSGGN